MSEPRSLYVHIKIKKERLYQYFQGKPVKAAVDPNWTSWWESRDMVSPTPLTDIPVYSNTTNRSIAEGFLSNPELVTYEVESPPEGVWIFSVLQLSENYEEILPTLAWLKNMADYMEPGDEGYALIYNYFWGDMDVMAHLVFKDQQAFFKNTSHTSEIEPGQLEAADATLKQAYANYSAQIDD